jgi:hypothetical protein
VTISCQRMIIRTGLFRIKGIVFWCLSEATD